VAVAANDFQDAAPISYEASVAMTEIRGHLGVPGPKQSGKGEEEENNDGAHHQSSYVSLLSRVLQVNIHL
jgi:hypothetical protein